MPRCRRGLRARPTPRGRSASAHGAAEGHGRPVLRRRIGRRFRRRSVRRASPPVHPRRTGLADCMEHQAKCRFCEMVNETDALAIDCDAGRHHLSVSASAERSEWAGSGPSDPALVSAGCHRRRAAALSGRAPRAGAVCVGRGGRVRRRCTCCSIEAVDPGEQRAILAVALDHVAEVAEVVDDELHGALALALALEHASADRAPGLRSPSFRWSSAVSKARVRLSRSRASASALRQQLAEVLDVRAGERRRSRQGALGRALEQPGDHCQARRSAAIRARPCRTRRRAPRRVLGSSVSYRQ